MKAGKAGWAVVQLLDFVEGFRVDEVLDELYRHVPGLQLYLPATRAGLIAKGHAFSTYVFVVCPEDSLSLLKLERSFMVESVLREPATRQVQKLADKDLRRLIQQQVGDDVGIGDRVRITAGDWAGIEATIVEVLGERVKALVQLHSRRSVLELPRNEIAPA